MSTSRPTPCTSRSPPDDICGAMVADDPTLHDDVLFGAACCLHLAALSGSRAAPEMDHHDGGSLMSGEVTVRVCPGGPLLLRGADTVVDEHGDEHPVTRPVVAVCACGKSARKPWCDSTHKAIPRPRRERDDRGPPDDRGDRVRRARDRLRRPRAASEDLDHRPVVVGGQSAPGPRGGRRPGAVLRRRAHRVAGRRGVEPSTRVRRRQSCCRRVHASQRGGGRAGGPGDRARGTDRRVARTRRALRDGDRRPAVGAPRRDGTVPRGSTRRDRRRGGRSAHRPGMCGRHRSPPGATRSRTPAARDRSPGPRRGRAPRGRPPRPRRGA